MKVLCICEKLQSMILHKGVLRGKVHSVFKNACNIQCGEEFITLLSRGKTMSPMSAIIDEGKDIVDFKKLNISQGFTFEFRKSEICCLEKNLSISMNEAQNWCSKAEINIITTKDSEQQLLENINILGQELSALGKLHEMGQLVNLLACDHPELNLVSFKQLDENYDFRNNLEFIKCRFINFMNAILKGDMERVGDAAQRVIGFGCGLTPSMDDFISGLMITYIYMGKYFNLNLPQIYEFNNKIISTSLNKTTRVSAEMLKHSSVGETNEAIQNLMTAIMDLYNYNNQENNMCYEEYEHHEKEMYEENCTTVKGQAGEKNHNKYLSYKTNINQKKITNHMKKSNQSISRYHRENEDKRQQENHKNIVKKLKGLIGYGETSGSDTALGIYVGLSILINIEYRRVWLNESACRSKEKYLL